MFSPSLPPNIRQPDYAYVQEVPKKDDPLSSDSIEDRSANDSGTPSPVDEVDAQVNIPSPEDENLPLVNQPSDQTDISSEANQRQAQNNNKLNDIKNLIEWSNNNQHGLDGLCKQLEENRKNKSKSDLPSDESVASGDPPPPNSLPAFSPGNELVSTSNNSDIARQLREGRNNSDPDLSEDVDEVKI